MKKYLHIVAIAFTVIISFIVFSNHEGDVFLGVKIPTKLLEISELQRDHPSTYTALEKIFNASERAQETDSVKIHGLSPNKIAPESDLLLLENRGYVMRISRPQWNAVWITSKGMTDMRGLRKFRRTNPPPSQTSST